MKSLTYVGFALLMWLSLPTKVFGQGPNKFSFSCFYYTTSNDSVLACGGQIAQSFGDSPKYFQGIFPLYNTLLNFERDDFADVRVFPNPFGQQLYIFVEGLNEQVWHIDLYDVMGNIVFTQTQTNASTCIDVNHLATGVYFIKVYTDQRTLKTEQVHRV